MHTHRNLYRLHTEVTNWWEGLGPCCQVVARGSSHCPHADQDGGGDVPDVLADIIQIWQPELLQEVLAQHGAADGFPEECVLVNVFGVGDCPCVGSVCVMALRALCWP